ncbi:hypothetical protein IV203_023447 [Nitzschia inconspicua]|uniref:Uncharacterized protein n=1 Tax=Nitzschia inconspicua TaxID=303405 RepID=A0A9K3KD78_9STRA|nr:hypothetical protein IV203_023447 [Nitzschia inconspicua]
MERMEVGDRENEEDTSSIGIRRMIGAAFMATKAHKVAAAFMVTKAHKVAAAFMATKAHKVAAPMASYLIRNGARFQFSHDFSYINIRSFFEEVHEDLEISAHEEGACRPGIRSLNWARPHPNKDHLKIQALNEECLPVINHLDFLDTKQFEVHDIFTCDIETIPPEIPLVMEEHAEQCCVVFVPFHNANTELQLHMNGGWPLDMVERLTSKPAKQGCLGEVNFEEEEVEDEINEAFDQFLLEGSLEGGFDNEFRNSIGQFKCQSILTRCHGSHQCGSNLVICPNVGHADRVLVVEACERMVSEGNEITVSRPNQDNYLNVQALNELAIKVVRRIVEKNGRVVDIGVNGTLENVRDFANIFFCDDGDQWRSFQINYLCIH